MLFGDKLPGTIFSFCLYSFSSLTVYSPVDTTPNISLVGSIGVFSPLYKVPTKPLLTVLIVYEISFSQITDALSFTVIFNLNSPL